MKQTIDLNGFHQAFTDYGRGDQFSYEGLGKLFEYLQDLEDSTGEEMELDVIAICCDWSEYESATKAVLDMTNWKPNQSVDEDEQEEQALEYLRECSNVIDWLDNGGVIVQSF